MGEDIWYFCRGYFVCPFLLFYQVAPSPFRPVGYFGGVLWRLGTFLWHIHGFSTDTQACMFLREPQHVTAMGTPPTTTYNDTSVSLFDIDLGPSTKPGVTAMLAPGSC